MQIITATDPQKGAGYAVFTLSRITGEGFPPVSERTELLIQSSSTRAFWSDGKWVQGKAGFKPDAILQDGSVLRVFLGPDIVDQLDPVETYQLCLVGPEGQEHCGVFFLENVLPSPVRGGQAPEPPKPAAVEPPVTPEVKPDIPSFPVEAALTVEESVPEKKLPEEQTAPSVADDLVVTKTTLADLHMQHAEAQKRSSKLLYVFIAMGILVILLITVAIMMDEDAASPVAPVANKPATQSVTLADVRNMVMANTPQEQLLEIFTTTEWTADNADARFLLAEVLAEKYHNGFAMVVLGQFYDPANTTTPSGSIVKDGEQAVYWYKEAQKAGVTGVQSRLDALQAWAKREAEAGNTDATDVLKAFEN